VLVFAPGKGRPPLTGPIRRIGPIRKPNLLVLATRFMTRPGERAGLLAAWRFK
jgi:hypothetical protein